MQSAVIDYKVCCVIMSKSVIIQCLDYRYKKSMNSCLLMIFNKYNNFQTANVFIQLLLLHVYPYILLTNKKFNLIGLRSSMVDRSISSTIIFFRPVHHSKLTFNQSLHNGHSKRALVVNVIT